MTWLRKAAEKGEPRALLVVGTALFNGDGLPQDPVLGYAYVSRAAAQGLAPAKSTLAEMDKIMTVEERQKGVAIALAAAKGQPAPKPGGKAPAPSTKTPATVASKPSAGPEARAPAVTPAGGWRVQLGAFSAKSAAQALYAKLQGRLGGASAYYVPAGAVTRLQVGPFSKADAAATCVRLKPQPCFPVPAR